MIFLEAEQGSITAPMAAQSHAQASACGFVTSHEAGAGEVTFTVNLSQAGNYWLWGRTRAEHSGANSFWVSVDGAAEVRWDFAVATDWSWSSIKNALTGVQVYFPLGAGAHTIRIRCREGSSPLDALAVGLDQVLAEPDSPE